MEIYGLKIGECYVNVIVLFLLQDQYIHDFNVSFT
jgi:hypothetical protein